MSESTPAFRDHLVRVLEWDDAHVTFDRAVEGIPADGAARAPRASSTRRGSSWNTSASRRRTSWISASTPSTRTRCDGRTTTGRRDAAPPGPQAWTDSLASYARDREALKRLAHDIADLTAPVPTGTATQTYLRAILLTADHTAYHVGQIVALRRALGLWPPA